MGIILVTTSILKDKGLNSLSPPGGGGLLNKKCKFLARFKQMFIIVEFTLHRSLNLVEEQNVKIYALSLAFNQSTLRESTNDQFQDLDLNS